MEYPEVIPTIIRDQKFKKNSFKIRHVESSLSFNNKFAKTVSNNWQDFLEDAHERGAKPWDGTYYRLENIDEVEAGSNILNFSTIKYSQIMGINYNRDLAKVLRKSRSHHISTASLIQTIDGFFIFGVRNRHSMRNNKIDLIGGGLQPEEVSANKTEDIFANAIKEMTEETGLTRDTVEKISGLGIVNSSRYNVIFIFYTKIKKSREEVEEIFDKKNDEEMKALEFIPEKELENYLADKGSYRKLVAGMYFRNR